MKVGAVESRTMSRDARRDVRWDRLSADWCDGGSTAWEAARLRDAEVSSDGRFGGGMLGPDALPILSPDPRLPEVLGDISAGGGPELLWYPSSGHDFRPIMEFSEQRMHLHGFTKRPTLMIYTDGEVDPSSIRAGQTLHESRRTVVRCLETVPVVTPNFRSLRSTDFHGLGGECRACLLRVEADSLDVGRCSSWVLLVRMTNHQFLLGWCGLLGVRVGTLVRVRMGLGFGLCSECLSSAYPWLRWIGVQQMLSDGEAQPDRRTAKPLEADLLEHGFPPDPPAFSIRSAGTTHRWSGFDVRALRFEAASGVIHGAAERMAVIRAVASWGA